MGKFGTQSIDTLPQGGGGSSNPITTEQNAAVQGISQMDNLFSGIGSVLARDARTDAVTERATQTAEVKSAENKVVAKAAAQALAIEQSILMGDMSSTQGRLKLSNLKTQMFAENPEQSTVLQSYFSSANGGAVGDSLKLSKEEEFKEKLKIDALNDGVGEDIILKRRNLEADLAAHRVQTELDNAEMLEQEGKDVVSQNQIERRLAENMRKTTEIVSKSFDLDSETLASSFEKTREAVAAGDITADEGIDRNALRVNEMKESLRIKGVQQTADGVTIVPPSVLSSFTANFDERLAIESSFLSGATKADVAKNALNTKLYEAQLYGMFIVEGEVGPSALAVATVERMLGETALNLTPKATSALLKAMTRLSERFEKERLALPAGGEKPDAVVVDTRETPEIRKIITAGFTPQPLATVEEQKKVDDYTAGMLRNELLQFFTNRENNRRSETAEQIIMKNGQFLLDLSSQSTADFVTKMGGIGFSENDKPLVQGAITEFIVDDIFPAIKDEWHTTINNPNPAGGIIKPSESEVRYGFNGEVFRFEAGDGDHDVVVAQSMNNKVAPLMTKLIRASAHSMGHTDYQKVWDNHKASILEMFK